jgi:tryptophan synthase alpha subunit
VGIILRLWGLIQDKSEEDLDYVFSPSQVARKSDKTLKLLEFLSKQDPTVEPETLKKQAETTFLKLQECWQARNYAQMKSFMVPDIYANHCLQLQEMTRNHEIWQIPLLFECWDLRA